MSRKKIRDISLDLKKIGNRIFYVRDILKLNQVEFAKKVGISKSNISNIENHKYEPSYQTLGKIVEKCGISSLWLLTCKGPPLEHTQDVSLSLAAVYGENDGRRAVVDHVASGEAPFSTLVNPTSVEGAGIDPFAEAVSGLKEIFESNDRVLVPAIEANIRAFRIAVRRGRTISAQAGKIESLENDIKDLKVRLKTLEDRPGYPDQEEEKEENTGKKAM